MQRFPLTLPRACAAAAPAPRGGRAHRPARAAARRHCAAAARQESDDAGDWSLSPEWWGTQVRRLRSRFLRSPHSFAFPVRRDAPFR
jgi:hypothetical protein